MWPFRTKMADTSFEKISSLYAVTLLLFQGCKQSM